MTSKIFRINDNEVVEVNKKVNKTVVNLFNKLKNNKSKNLTCIPNIWAMRKSIFQTFNAKKTFNHLKQAFIKALILWHFDLKSHIWIKIEASNYAISKMLS